MLAPMRRLLVTLVVAVLGGAVLAPQASAALTAREIRIADHPGFVRVVVDFTGGRVEPGEVVATDPNPFPDGFVRLRSSRAGSARPRTRYGRRASSPASPRTAAASPSA